MDNYARFRAPCVQPVHHSRLPLLDLTLSPFHEIKQALLLPDLLLEVEGVACWC